MSNSALVIAVALNPAFLEEIKDSNTTLWSRWAALREACHDNEDSRSMLCQIVQLLNELRDSLALQFSLEEAYGYVELPGQKVDAGSLHIDRIRGQHCSLYLQLNELTEIAEDLQYRGAQTETLLRLITQIQQFDLEWQDHERTERNLIALARRGIRDQLRSTL